MTPTERLNESLSSLGISLDPKIQAALIRFLEILLRENEKINLTAIKSLDDGITKHIVDSLTALGQFPADSPLNLIDVGSGGGFPGIALALALPKAQVTLVESTKKKAHFLNLAAAELGLIKQVRVEADRAETLGQGAIREKADFVTCRAVGKIPAILELGIPLLKTGGKLILYKGPNYKEELATATKALNVLKAELTEEKLFKLPLSEESRSLLIFEKKGATTKFYPRLPGMPENDPL